MFLCMFLCIIAINLYFVFQYIYQIANGKWYGKFCDFRGDGLVFYLRFLFGMS